MMAAMKTKTGTVGFIGGMDIPIISRFGCGYIQGVKAVNPDVKVIYNMTGTTPSAWNDPVKGGELTKAQVSQGADIVYHAAGGTGVGVLQAAADAGILGIGVDKNQNHLHPGQVLTSMVKRVDTGVYDAFTAGADLAGGFATLSLANGGISYSMDEHNVGLVTKAMVDAVEEAKAHIISGELKVHDYMSDSSCPVK
jgi:basic membrane protein A